MRTGWKRLLSIALGRDLPFFPEVAVDAVVLGSEYGGHCVAPRGLGSSSTVYSFGIGEDASFDLELIERTSSRVHAFDPTPRSIAWVERQPMPPTFVMHPIGLAAHDGRARFRPPDDSAHVSHTVLERPGTEHAAIEVVVKRLATVMRELGHGRLDVLKLDIEGAEYDVVDDVLASRLEIDQILVEFHHHLREVPIARTRRAVQALRASGYRIFHVSPSGREYSFIHERRLGSA